MLKISEDDQAAAGLIMRTTRNCNYFIDCLWGKLAKNTEKNCPQCFLIKFRKELEEQSPAFMGLYKRLSNYDILMHDYLLIELEGDASQKGETGKGLKDLHRFGDISFYALVSLYSANEGIPYVSKEMIESASKDFSLGFTIKELEEINSKWVMFLNFYCFSLEHHEHYKYDLYLLVKIFIRAIEEERGWIPPLYPEERQELFKEIENFLIRNRA